MSTALVPASTAVLTPISDQQIPALPWRDPHTVSPEKLATCIAQLENACLANPRSADLRTRLGVAYAVNYDVYKSMDALEAAIEIEPTHFWAQLKYGELNYRLRALQRAEEETIKALDLANNAWQFSLARNQLQAIRQLNRASTRNIEWTKPLTMPALVLAGFILAVFVAMILK